MKKDIFSRSFVISIFAILSMLIFGCVFSVAAAEDGTVEPPVVPESYELERMVILSRHNIRSPLSQPGSVLDKVTPHDWFDWTSNSGELSMRGGVEETIMGQFFRKYLDMTGLIEENSIPEPGEIRFYANSMQRTIATARFFASGFSPLADIDVEYTQEIGKMDPVFNPQITKISDTFVEKALSEIAAMGGEAGLQGIPGGLAENYQILEKTLDFSDSEYAKENGIEHFPMNDLEVFLEENKEPYMTGSLKTTCSAADALVLQYYEEADEKEAAFGHELSQSDWTKIADITDTYQKTLFTAPSVAINVAHPMLQELKKEMTVEGRKFSFLCGHDSNIASVLSALGVMPYKVPGTISQFTPIGVKLVFSVWRNESGEEFVSINLYYQTPEQLRSGSIQTLETPPQYFAPEFEGLERDEKGLYRLSDVLDRFDESINAYDLL